jgi:hypothetical protein
MSANYTGGIGISQFSDATLTKVTVSEKLETKTYMDHTGNFGGFATYDPTGDFSCEGYGDTCPASIAASLTNPTGVSGGQVIVDMVETSQKNDDFKSFKYSGKVYPNAS